MKSAQGPGAVRQASFEDLDVVGERVVLEAGLAQDDHSVIGLGAVLVEEREDGIRRVDREGVGTRLPELDEPAGRDVANLPPRSVGEVDSRVGQSVKRDGSGPAGESRRALDEQRVDPLDLCF